MAKANVADVATKIVKLLGPLNSDERQRVVHAALTLVGEKQADLQVKTGAEDDKGKEDSGSVLPRVRTWMHQNGLTMAQLQQVFHLDDGKSEVIASEIPGRNDKEKTLNAFVLEGINRLLSSGDTAFDDKAARALCKNLGCYNEANHATYMKDKGNKLAGTKEQGWRLTAPGLTHGAQLVKEMTKAAK
jgi:hypothetical protein